MKIRESGENYLEVMLILNKERGYIRSVDIANKLSYSKPSVSRAVSILRKAGHIVMDEDGLITLTESGRLIAEKIYERHCFLFLCKRREVKCLLDLSFLICLLPFSDI